MGTVISLGFSAYPWSVGYKDDYLARSTIFEAFVWHNMGLNPGFLDDWRTRQPLCQWAGRYTYI